MSTPLLRRLLPEVPTEEYAAVIREKRRSRSLIMLWYCALIYPAFGLLDFAVYPEKWKLFVALRMVGVAFGIAGLIIGRFQPRATAFFGILVFVYATISVEAMCVMTEGFDSRYIIGLMVCFVAGSTIEVMSVPALAGFLGAVFVAHQVLNAFLDPTIPPGSIASALFFVGGGALLCIIAALLLENQNRTIFLTQRALAASNQRLREAQEHQREFFAKITHELRTPVNSISGLMELISSTETLTSKGKRKADLILTSSERLRQLINDILDIAKHEAVGLQVTARPVDVTVLVREIAESSSSLVGHKEVRVEHTSSVTFPITTDETRLRQILMNLMSNAVKYTMEGNVKLSAVQDGDGVRFTVEDTGIGIAADSKARLFRAFSQTKTEHGSSGTGLGLNIVSSFAQLLQGTVGFESEEGRGSRFWVRIPASYRDERRAA